MQFNYQEIIYFNAQGREIFREKRKRRQRYIGQVIADQQQMDTRRRCDPRVEEAEVMGVRYVYDERGLAVPKIKKTG